jgi:DNA primase
MSLSPQFLDELRARTSLSTLVGRTVKLQKAGREWKAPCPFHKEKTPSFYVNDEKGFYHCFGCSVHGDAIRWLTDQRGLPFMDAVKELADAAGMEVPAADPKAQEKAQRAIGLYDVMQAAKLWFEEQLRSTEGDRARLYLEERGVTEATRKKFGLGYAPDSRQNLAKSLQFGAPLLIEAGLLISPDGNREPYDRFRGRLMIPIRDQRGRVIAFGGRILGEGEPKYLNSPETPLFDKGRTLYNIDLAAPASRASGRLIVAEGYMDVIALDQAGFNEAVAPLGTAVTETQIQRLWTITNKPLFCFDGDAAGQKAALRAARRAIPYIKPSHTLGFVPLPPGKDPDDLIRASGRAAMLGLLARAEDLADYLWKKEVDESDTATPEGRAGVKQRLMELASSIEDPFVREQYKADFKDKFWDTFGWKSKDLTRVSAEIAASRQAKRAGFQYLVLRSVLFGLCRYPDILVETFDEAAKLDFKEVGLHKWFQLISSAILQRPTITEDLIEQILASSATGPMEKRDLSKDLAFSFFRRHEHERGRCDLREVIGTLVAEREVDEALAEAQSRFKAKVETAEWEQHQRLSAVRADMRERLKRFVEDAGQGSASAAS